jgi:PAS domain S-box-containing protein
LPSSIEKRRTIVYLRGLLLVALGGVLLEAGAAHAGANGLALLAIYGLSNISLILSVPLRMVRSLRFELIVGAIDLVAIALAIALAGARGGVLPVSCLVLGLVLALATERSHAIAGAGVICALHAWSLLAITDGNLRQLAPQLLFLASLALYYGYLAAGIHRFRTRARAEELSMYELQTLLEILDAITQARDLEHVTRIVVQKINLIVPSVRCSMLFIDPTGTRCYVIASHDDPNIKMLELNLEKYPEVREAIATRNPVLVQDIASDPLMSDVRGILEELDLHSIMVVPMVFGDDVLGTLCMKTSRANQPFSEREVNFCTAVARASASALKNAALNREVLETSNRHREAAEKLSRIFDDSPDLILTTDNDGQITELNHAAERLLGRARETVLGLSCVEILGDGVQGLVDRTLAWGAVANHPCNLIRKDGSSFEVELNVSTLRNEDGDPAGTVWLGRDVSELKATHRQLIQAEKLSTVGEVISGVAHELNNPLSVVLGYSQLVLSRQAGSPVRRELERVHESATRCQKIVSNLLSFARGHKPERRYANVNGIIDKTLEIRKYQLHVNNIEVVRDLAEDLPSTLVDSHQMQQVLLNLFNNAQHAMNGDRERAGRLEVRTSHENGWIRIEVSDNGHGMSPATIEKIFDPFFTTKEVGQGTGLGLSVSYGIVKEHGGRIDAMSSPDNGSTFLIDLPIRKPIQAETAVEASVEIEMPAAATARRAPADGRILVVDDEPMIVDLLAEVLEERGYHVETAGNGGEACKKIGPNSYDLVISDVRMPEMTGIDLYRRIVAVRPELEGRVIFITGDLMDPQTVDFLSEVHARTLPKPLDIDIVVETVAATLAGAEAGVPT